jgi:hypothetical protein
MSNSRGNLLSSSIVAPARHLRLKRIASIGATLVAASVAIVVFGQSGLVPSAAAADSVRSAVIAPAQSDRQLLAESAQLHAVVKAQQAEQAAAAQAAAAHAAAIAARAAAAQASTVTVWTAGWQAQINACHGAVDITAHYGTPTVAQHWGCGGSSFPTAAGAVVKFTGLDAGTYRVIGVAAVLNAYTAKTNQLPHGYDMLFQTCRNNNSHTTEFVALQKIG